jgi:Transposase IS116/IS110/IS902 family
MTAPGVGAITALCFLATIDDPTRYEAANVLLTRVAKWSELKA